MKNISLKVEDELHEQASQKANQANLSLAELVRVAIRAYCVEGTSTEQSASSDLLTETRGQLRVKDTQIESLAQQLDHVHQLLAIAQKSIQQLTEQNQLLLEDQRRCKPSVWKRIFRWT